MADSTTNDAAKPAFKLVVLQHFDDYVPGDTITDSGAVNAVLAGENAKHVTKVAP